LEELETDTISVARLRLGDLQKRERERTTARKSAQQGRMTVGEAIRIYEERVQTDPAYKPRTKLY
jgi:hypothetical protein